MHQKTAQHSASLVLLICLGILTASFILLVPNPTITRPTRSRSLAQFPSTISLEYRGERFATEAASLMTAESISHYTYSPSWSETYFSFITPLSLVPSHPFDTELLKNWVQSIAASLNTPAVPPSVRLIAGKSVAILPGKVGTQVLSDKTIDTLTHLDFSATTSAQIQTSMLGKELTPDEIQAATAFANQFIGKSLVIKGPHLTRKVESADILALLDLPTSYSSEALSDLAGILDNEVGTDPIEPELMMNGTTIEKFTAPRDGQRINRAQFQSQLISKLEELTRMPSVEPLTLLFESSPPKKSLAQTNTLGISERIGLGESAYAHSIPNRVHNVSLTTSRIHAKLIQPGEEFSFNKYLGEVSAKTGFKPAYVIKQGQTVLGDGGGVCQVSSTLFRAVLSSGLPITERKGHSYRVSYYEENSKPGFDATVYSPHPDFRFKNDTGHAILINAVADPKTLSMYIELWGTSDGRKAEIQNYRQWDASSAPAPVYQDDPTLPHGKLKQIDYAAPGLKTAFEYVVTYPDGAVTTKTYSTTYTPWRAVYLRGI